MHQGLDALTHAIEGLRLRQLAGGRCPCAGSDPADPRESAASSTPRSMSGGAREHGAGQPAGRTGLPTPARCQCMRWRTASAATSTCRTARATPAAADHVIRSSIPSAASERYQHIAAIFGVPGGDERAGRGHCGTTPALASPTGWPPAASHAARSTNWRRMPNAMPACSPTRAGPASPTSRRSMLKPLTKRCRLPGRKNATASSVPGERSFKKSYYPNCAATSAGSERFRTLHAILGRTGRPVLTPRRRDRRCEHARRSRFRSAGSQPDRPPLALLSA